MISGECLSIREDIKLPTSTLCVRCNYISSQTVCKACVLLEGLNKGKPKLGIGKSSRLKEKMENSPHDLVGEQTSAPRLKNIDF